MAACAARLVCTVSPHDEVAGGSTAQSGLPGTCTIPCLLAQFRAGEITEAGSAAHGLAPTTPCSSRSVAIADIGGYVSALAVENFLGGNMAQNASKLHVHPNTVYQRLERIDHVLGHSGWRRPPGALEMSRATGGAPWVLKARKHDDSWGSGRVR